MRWSKAESKRKRLWKWRVRPNRGRWSSRESRKSFLARENRATSALESESATTAIESITPGESEDGEIVGEIDDDDIQDDPYLPAGFQSQREWESDGVVDVEVVDAGYTDAPMSGFPGMM